MRGLETLCSFYLESFLFHRLFFYSIEHPHASRHFQHISPFFSSRAFLKAQSVLKLEEQSPI